MVVTVVGCSGGASGGGFGEHGGGCPLGCRASAGLPAPPLQAASTTTATTGSAEITRLQVRQVRTGHGVPAAADAPRHDDPLITTLSLRSALRSWRQTRELNLSARLQSTAAQ